MHQIPGDGSPILMQHGVKNSALAWVMNSKNKALAFMMANKGHDVWLGNNRGNTYSMKHVEYTSRQKEFWDFDQEEMGIYDLPAEIDHVLSHSNNTKLTYVGHS